jgi:RNA polymerase sigma-B factor
MVSEVARVLGRSQEEVRGAMAAIAGRYAASRDLPNADGGERPQLLDLGAEPDPGYARVEHAMLLEDLLAALDARAREVVRLANRDGMLQREIAERVGCSQMHVSRILRDALNRMRLGADLALTA